MSNFAQHRMPIYNSRPAQPLAGFRCEICQSLFAKQYSLKYHEQKIHGIVRPEDAKPAPATMAVPPSVTTVVIPAIETKAMAIAKARGEIPFAVLHMLNEVPLIVRVVEQGMYSVLKAAESCDFRESQRGGPGLEETQSVSIAVVATVYQKVDKQGRQCYEITGPVSCCQTNSIPQLEEQYDEILQDSLQSSNMFKTLTQLNATEISCTTAGARQKKCGLPAMRPHEVEGPVPSSSGRNTLKRKLPPKAMNVPPPPIKRSPLQQPKVITVTHNPGAALCTTPPHFGRPLIGERSFQDIVSGSLLSPKRTSTTKHNLSDEVISVEPEDPFRDINVMDLVRAGQELLATDMDVDIDGPDDGIYIPVL